VGERVSVLDAYRTCDCPTVASCADNGAYTLASVARKSAYLSFLTSFFRP
jgi:hypothetical protein